MRSLDRPFPTITAGGTHLALVQFLIQYYGSSTVASIDEPLPTVTTKDRFGLVTCDGARYSIHLRMLRRGELAAANGFPATYRFCGNGAEVTKQIGNAVPPPMAAALCKAVLQMTCLFQPDEVFYGDFEEFEVGGAAAVHQAEGDRLAAVVDEGDLVDGVRVPALDQVAVAGRTGGEVELLLGLCGLVFGHGDDR